MWKRFPICSRIRRRIPSLSDAGMSAMATWQESEWVSLPMLHTCRSCTSFTPGMARMICSMRCNSMPLGVPSSRMLRLSRMIPMEDQTIMTPMPTESAGSDLNGADDLLNALQLHAAGSAFQQDVEALADDPDGRPDDHDADAHGKCGVRSEWRG